MERPDAAEDLSTTFSATVRHLVLGLAALGMVVSVAALTSCTAPDEIWSNNGTQVTAQPGSSHCDQQSITFLPWDGRMYARDPNGVIASEYRENDYAAAVEVPADAVDTGLRSSHKEVWRSRDGTALYIVDGGNVERWPEVTFGCQ